MSGFKFPPDLSTLLALLSAVTFIAVACWEALRPSRPTATPMNRRWTGNLVLFAAGWVIAWLLPFLSTYAAAMLAEKHGWGLLHRLAMPFGLALVLSLVAQDFAGYWAHRLFHAVPMLWRLHAVHHSDTDLDVTTTIRHHPLEAVAQALFDAAFAIALGLPPLSVVLYGGIVLAVQIFHHGNVTLPARLCWLGAWLITPDLHRVHHSMAYRENNSNFGNLVPVWDRLFGTFCPDPRAGFRVGLPEFANAGSQRLGRLLIQPLLVEVAQIRPSSRS